MFKWRLQKIRGRFALFGFPQIGNLMTPAQNHQASECWP